MQAPLLRSGVRRVLTASAAASPARGRSQLDFSAAPAEALRPDVLLIDATYFACCCAPRGGSAAAHAEALVAMLRGMLGALRPRAALACFDSGARKEDAGGEEARKRRRAAAAGAPWSPRGDPRPLAAALHAQLALPSLLAAEGDQGDHVVLSLASRLGCDATAASARVLLASGDSDLCVALRAPAAPGAEVQWLRCAGHPTAAWPRPLTLLRAADFVRLFGYPPRRHAAYGALVGRPRDGVRGLAGVGPRGARVALRACAAAGAAEEADAALLARLFDKVEAGQVGGWTPTLRAALARPGARREALANLERTTGPPGAAAAARGVGCDAGAVAEELLAACCSGEAGAAAREMA